MRCQAESAFPTADCLIGRRPPTYYAALRRGASMRTIRRCTLHLITLWCLALSGAAFVLPTPATAEWYAAGQVGPTFADSLKNIGGTGSLSGLAPVAPDSDLKK